jgi:YD repeat-containing protein
MVTPSGARVEFRQVDGSTDTFETADSSYLQLKVLDANNLRLLGTDGTNVSYQLKNGAFYCASIKDSNGNFITVNHDTNGRLQSVTDTLGRVINVNYDAAGQPIMNPKIQTGS